MGRNKIKIQKIDNERIRQVTFYKRKRGLIKKSMELSLLCEVKVLLCVVDKNEKLLVYCSDGMTSETMQNSLSSETIQKEYLTNDDYKNLFSEILNLDDEDLGSRVDENEKNLKEEEDNYDLISRKTEKEAVINTFKVQNRSESKKRNEILESRSQNRLNSSNINKSLQICLEKIGNKNISSIERGPSKKDETQTQRGEMANLKLVNKKELGQAIQNIPDIYCHNQNQNEQYINAYAGNYLGNEFISTQGYDSNYLQNYVQMTTSNYNNSANNDVNPLVSVQANQDTLKNMISFNFPNSATSRNIGLGIHQNQNDLNNQKILQGVLNQNYVNRLNQINNMNNQSSAFNYQLSQLVTMLQNNNQSHMLDKGNSFSNQNVLTNLVNPKIANLPYENFGGGNSNNDYFRKRMRDSDIVNNLMASNINEKQNEANLTTSYPGKEFTYNTNSLPLQNYFNAQSAIYNYIQTNQNMRNSAQSMDKESKQD